MMSKKNVVKLTGRQSLNMSIATGNTSSTQLMYPANLSSRLVNLAKVFEFYRFTKMRFNVHPSFFDYASEPTVGYAGEYSLAYDPEGTNATSTSITYVENIQQETSFVGVAAVVNIGTGSGLTAPGCTSVRRWMVPKRVLLSTPTKWFRNAALTSEDSLTTQGIIIAAVANAPSGVTWTICMDLEYEIEFCGAGDFADIGARIGKVSSPDDDYENVERKSVSSIDRQLSRLPGPKQAGRR